MALESSEISGVKNLLLVRYSPNFLYSRLFSSPRRPGPDGEGGVEAWDGMTPLHLACEGGLDIVLQTLVEHKANVNSKVCHRLKKEKKIFNVYPTYAALMNT